MLVPLISIFFTLTKVKGDLTELQYLNELPLDKLLRLKSSLQELVTTYENVTTTPTYSQSFGAQALALNAPPPVKRLDYESLHYKKEGQSKLSKLFTVSVTALAFLAFGGYLLCLIVQAVKAKQSYNPSTVNPTFLISAGMKKKPQSQSQFASYGRTKRDNYSSNRVDLPAEQMFEPLPLARVLGVRGPAALALSHAAPRRTSLAPAQRPARSLR
ncbi:unnamed protein product [Chilo suppressalis]|uniref:Uncharacterized protein n=1 Tax=Chilo suppressalis TaxID=168631 RepID=A0ABN8AX30_CHISP|nr:unnamed protein product [Chilo suppressalis]